MNETPSDAMTLREAAAFMGMSHAFVLSRAHLGSYAPSVSEDYPEPNLGSCRFYGWLEQASGSTPRRILVTRESVKRLAQNVRAEKRAAVAKTATKQTRKIRAADRVAALTEAPSIIEGIEKILFKNSLNLRLVNHTRLRFLERQVWACLGFVMAAFASRTSGLRSLSLAALEEALLSLQEENLETPEHEADLPEDVRDLTAATHEAWRALTSLAARLG